MREAAITLLACAMVLVPAPVALASQQTAAVGAASGGAREGVEPRSDKPEKPGKPSPTSSPDDPGDPEESGDPDEPRDPDDPEEEPSRPSWPSLPPWPPGGGSSPSPDPTPTPEPTSGEPSGEPSGTAPGGDGDGGDDRGERKPDGPDDGASAEPPGTSRQSPQGWTEQISDQRAGTGGQYDDYVYDDGEGGRRYSESRATPATGGQLLPVLPLGAGLTFLGLGLASFALRLRR